MWFISMTNIPAKHYRFLWVFFKNMLISVPCGIKHGIAKKLLLQSIFLYIFTETIVRIKILNPAQYIII
jgi:hypothetical protein